MTFIERTFRDASVSAVQLNMAMTRFNPYRLFAILILKVYQYAYNAAGNRLVSVEKAVGGQTVVEQ